MGEEPISLSPPDPAWPRLFEAEREQLERVLLPWLAGPIEHIGSTAVPGMPAKPVIDIMAPVHGLAESLDARSAVAGLGYVYFPYRPEQMHWFCKPSPERRTHHLHLVPFQGSLWQDRLLFRDYLRTVPEAAEEYRELKARLAARYRNDREAYTDGKAEFVAEVLRQARA
jgi:GrpB-like predicted nucleotidyltransferase (UPF0157 family)